MKLAEFREIYDRLGREEITMSKAVELINEKFKPVEPSKSPDCDNCQNRHNPDECEECEKGYSRMKTEQTEAQQPDRLKELFELEQQLGIREKDRFHNSDEGKRQYAAIEQPAQMTAEEMLDVFTSHYDELENFPDEDFFFESEVIEFAKQYAQQQVDAKEREWLKQVDEWNKKAERLKELIKERDAEMRNLHQLMITGEQRGIKKANQEWREKIQKRIAELTEYASKPFDHSDIIACYLYSDAIDKINELENLLK